MKNIVRSIILFATLWVGLSCASKTPQDAELATKKFNAFLDASFDEFMSYSPEGLAYFGKKEQYNKLNDYTEEFDLKMLEITKKKLKELKKFDRSDLDAQAQLSYDLYKKDLEKGIEEFQWKDYGYSVNQQGGVHTDLPTFMINIHKVDSEKDLQDYIARLKEFKRVFAEVGDQVLRSKGVGIVPPKFVFPYIYESSKKVLSGKPFDKSKNDSPIFADFKSKLKKLKLDVKKNKEYTAQAEAALKGEVAQAYDGLVTVIEQVEKAATTDDGAWKFPRGDEFYAIRLKRYTTTEMTADQIHEVGLQNVARLRGEMEAIQKKLKVKGSLSEFFAQMRKDPQQYFPNSESGRNSYIKLAQGYLDNVNKKVPEYFRLIPKTPMDIKAVEKFREASSGKAFYNEPSDDGARPGTYYVNLADMRNVPKFEAEALLYHEGIPGHHFQIALGIELRNLPKYRRYKGYTAFVEGWGLYTERLAKDMGGYKDDYSELGRLSMEMTRACRLVVDTGIHSKKWTREKAISFFNDNLPVAPDAQKEQIERYIIWPGQATAYMIGMLKILELRAQAQQKLGNNFDYRDFHDVVLENGAVPLDVLETNVKKYIKGKKL
ncbi:MAG: DUF885 domain-containing protein [Bdellovibrionaceae bacterium]|nr:DUF885 domain-containing protein [Pseudobdellovibrionaceae bacterium]